MAKLGADPEQLKQLGVLFSLTGGDVVTIGATINMELMGTDWTGPDAQRFRDAWREFDRALQRVGHACMDMGARLIAQAEQQETVSGVTQGGGALGGMAGAGRGAGSGFGSPASNAAVRDLMEFQHANPAAFQQAMARGGPAAALQEWTSQVGVFDEGGWRPAATPEEARAIREQMAANPLGGMLGRSSGGFGRSWSVEGATEGNWNGIDYEAQGKLAAEYGGQYSGSVAFGDERLAAQIEGGVYAGASAEGEIRGSYGFAPFEARAAGHVAAEANVAAGLEADREGISGRGGADAFLGGSAEADGRIGGDTFSVGANVGGNAGLGLKADALGELSTDRVSFGTSSGLTFGMGVDYGYDVSFDPSALVSDLGDWTGDIATDIRDISIGAVGSSVSSAASELGSTADAVVGGVIDTGKSVVEGAGKTVKKLNPLNW
jgi:hypothetical protein